MNIPTPLLPHSSTEHGLTKRYSAHSQMDNRSHQEQINDCVLEVFLSPFQQGRLPNSFWHLCQPTSSDVRWVTWLYPSCQIQSRLQQSRSELHRSTPIKNTVDSFRMVHSQEAPSKSVYQALLQAITLATSRVVIIEMHHLITPSDNSNHQYHLSRHHYESLNRACDQHDCQLVILHSSVH